MTLAPSDAGPVPAGGGADPAPLPAGVRPREGGRTRPALARLMDRRPHPRLRRLADVLAERAQRRPVDDEPRTEPTDASTPAWEAALAGARSQVGPVALRVLAAVAEVLDGRRPPEHLGRIGPPGLVERVRAAADTGPGLPRGARVRGLRMCPVLAPVAGGTPVLAVEVAAALCAPAPDDGPPPRARAVAARFELGTDRTTWRLTELLVV